MKLTTLTKLNEGIRYTVNHPNGDQLILDVTAEHVDELRLRELAKYSDYPPAHVVGLADRDDDEDWIIFQVAGRGNNHTLRVCLDWPSAIVAADEVIAEWVERNSAEPQHLTEARLTGEL